MRNKIVKGEYKEGVLIFTKEDGSTTHVDLFHTTTIRTEILEKMIKNVQKKIQER